MNKELKELYIIGSGGFGRVVLDTVGEINKKQRKYDLAGFIDDDESLKGEVFCGVKIIGGVETFKKEICRDRMVSAVLAIANPQVKERIATYLDGSVKWETLIHPLAFISDHATIGTGCIVQNFSTVNNKAVLGDHCSIVCNTVIGHDTIVGDYSSFMPLCGVMGNCVLAERVFVGVGAIILQEKSVGADAFIGAGSLVLSDVESGAKMVGVPARRIE